MDDPSTAVDEDVLHRIAVAEGSIQSPYSHFGTLVAKVTTLYPFLVGVARDRDRTDYGTIARECGIHTTRQRRVLGILGIHEAVHGRPLLPAVVVKADREMPDGAYFRMVERAPNRTDDVPDDPEERRWIWETQREEVYKRWADGDRRGERDRSASA